MDRWTRQEPEKTLAPLDDDITINLPNTFISAAIRLGWRRVLVFHFCITYFKIAAIPIT